MRGVAIPLLMACACAMASACGRAEETVPGVASVAVTIAPARVEAGGPVLLSLFVHGARRRRGSCPPTSGCSSTRSTTATSCAGPTTTRRPRPRRTGSRAKPITYRRTMFIPRDVEPGNVRFEAGTVLAGVRGAAAAHRLRSRHAVVRGGHGVGGRADQPGGGRRRLARRRNGRGPGTAVAVVAEGRPAVVPQPEDARHLVSRRSTNQSPPFQRLKRWKCVGPSGSLTTVTVAPGSTQLIRIPLSPEQLGTADTVDLTVAVGQTFVPAATAQLKSGDTRELGIRLSQRVRKTTGGRDALMARKPRADKDSGALDSRASCPVFVQNCHHGIPV